MKRSVRLPVCFVLAAWFAVSPLSVAQADSPEDEFDSGDPAAAPVFPDVPRGHWADEAVRKITLAGLIEGKPQGQFRGTEPLARYEYVVSMARLLVL